MAKTVFITGASSGIGRALALELARRGYDLFLTARRLDVLEQVRADIATVDPTRIVEIRQLDVTDDRDVATAIAEAAEKLGRCDIVVANAGLGNSGLVGEGSIERARAIVETNLIGAIATIDAAVALFRRQGGGQIVGMSSVAGHRPGSQRLARRSALAQWMNASRTSTPSATFGGRPSSAHASSTSASVVTYPWPLTRKVSPMPGTRNSMPIAGLATMLR